MMTDKVKKLDTEVQMNELLNVIKLIYIDTERVMKGINAELEVYDELISQTVDFHEKAKLRIAQAQAAQKTSVNSKQIAQLIQAMDRMRAISDSEDAKAKSTEIVFVNDMEKK